MVHLDLTTGMAPQGSVEHQSYIINIDDVSRNIDTNSEEDYESENKSCGSLLCCLIVFGVLCAVIWYLQ